MSKVQKYTLLISISFAMVFFMLYAVLGGVNNGKPVPLAYPESGLSDDIFDSQNTEYLPNEQLSVPYAFKELPYYIDVVDGRCADVGTGHLVYGSEEITFFFSEFHKSENPHDFVL